MLFTWLRLSLPSQYLASRGNIWIYRKKVEFLCVFVCPDYMCIAPKETLSIPQYVIANLRFKGYFWNNEDPSCHGELSNAFIKYLQNANKVPIETIPW